MDRNSLNVELAHYRDIREYRPQVGDMVICHGWVQRTKWFGVITQIEKDGTIQLIKSGLPRLLVTMDTAGMAKNTQILNVKDIVGSLPGSYTITHQEGTVTVWYV